MAKAQRIRTDGSKPSPGPVDQGLVVVVGRWSGALAGALRAAHREAIDDWATRVGVGTSTAGDWEDKPDVIPHPVNQEALDTVLRRADEETKRRFVLLVAGDPLVWASDLAGLPQMNGVLTHRRDVTKTVVTAGAIAAFAPLDALERLAAQARGAYPVDAGLVAAHEKFADALAQLDATARPDQLVDVVARHADELLGLLDNPMAPLVRRRLEVATVGSCAHAGMLAFVIGDRRSARGCFALARDVADDSGDDTLRAQVMGVRAILLSPMPGGGRGGDPQRQASTLSEAIHHARRADPDTRASLHWWLATALAGTNNELGFRQAVGVAEGLADRVGTGQGSGWLARHFACWSDGQARDKNVGIGMLQLGRPEPALEAFIQALRGPRQGSWTATLLIDMAAAQVLLDEPEAACAGMNEALDLTERVGYGMGMQRALGVRDGFPPHWDGLACVRELDERLGLPA
jgi:hypothetical protein